MRKRNRLKTKSLIKTNNNKTMIVILLNVIIIFLLSATNYASIAFTFAFLYLIAKELQKQTQLWKIIFFLILSSICDISAGLNIGYTSSIFLLNYFFVTRVFKFFNLLTYFIAQALAFLIVNFACLNADMPYIKWFFIVEYNLVLFLVIYITNIVRRNHI